MHKRILLIENGIEETQSIQDKLSAIGYIIDVLESVRAGIAFEKNPDKYNIVIVDIQSTPSSEFRKFRALNKDVKILAVSASEIGSTENEINAIIRKPINFELLIHMLRKLAMPTVTLSNTYCL